MNFQLPIIQFCIGILVQTIGFQVIAQDRPNVIVLLADDQCTYSMGCYQTPGAKTPNLDQLAREGMIFDRHYDTTAICMASRVNIMTGLYEYKSGCNFDSGNLLRSIWQQSYPMQLRAAGYQTAFAGKFGFTVTDVPNGKGELPVSDFDRWGGGPGQTSYDTKKNESMRSYAKKYPHSTLSYAAFAEDFIRDASQKNAPFCLSISFKAPHHPVTPDPQFDHIYQDAKFVKPSNYGRSYGEHLSRQSQQGRQFERFESWHYADKYDQTMALYYQQIYAIDVATGRIREALKKHGQSENTVIIYTSDNGFLCGSHGYGSKVLPYEESSRVPLIICDPRHPNSGKQLRCKSLTGNVDIAATVLDLAQLEIDTQRLSSEQLPSPNDQKPGEVNSMMDGRSLVPLLDDPESVIHDWLPLINVWGPRAVHSLGVVTTTGKYIYWPYAAGDFTPSEEVFDMVDDRLELYNLLGPSKTASTDDLALVSELKTTYQVLLDDWRANNLGIHGYPRFATIFDPKVAWETKAKLYTR